MTPWSSDNREVYCARLETALHHSSLRKIVDYLEASKARVSDSRQRPPAAQHDSHIKADTILWRRFVSAPVICQGGRPKGASTRLNFVFYLLGVSLNGTLRTQKEAPSSKTTRL